MSKSVNKGSQNPIAKLNEAKVKEILTLYRVHKWTPKDIAERYKVARNTIYQVLYRTSWGHVNWQEINS